MHFNGFITFGERTRDGIVPVDITCYQLNRGFNGNIVAPFWNQYFGGSVHAFKMADNHEYKRLILQDLREGGFPVNPNADGKRSTILVLTWLRMRSAGEFNKKKNRFEVSTLSLLAA